MFTSGWSAIWCHVHGGLVCNRSRVSVVATETRLQIECKLTDEMHNYKMDYESVRSLRLVELHERDSSRIRCRFSLLCQWE